MLNGLKCVIHYIFNSCFKINSSIKIKKSQQQNQHNNNKKAANNIYDTFDFNSTISGNSVHHKLPNINVKKPLSTRNTIILKNYNNNWNDMVQQEYQLQQTNNIVNKNGDWLMKYTENETNFHPWKNMQTKFSYFELVPWRQQKSRIDIINTVGWEPIIMSRQMKQFKKLHKLELRRAKRLMKKRIKYEKYIKRHIKIRIMFAIEFRQRPTIEMLMPTKYETRKYYFQNQQIFLINNQHFQINENHWGYFSQRNENTTDRFIKNNKELSIINKNKSVTAAAAAAAASTTSGKSSTDSISDDSKFDYRCYFRDVNNTISNMSSYNLFNKIPCEKCKRYK